MRNEFFKQLICISDTNPDVFQERMNNALYGKTDPDIIMDQNIPFTAYIYYKVEKNIPEDLLELFEMLDGQHYCRECPHFEEIPDKRRKLHHCSYYNKQTRRESRACEQFYRNRRAEIKELENEYKTIPDVVK